MKDSLQILLRGLLDYAGLFPPAGLSIETSFDNFRHYRAGEHAEMLRCFVLPAARLGEFLGLFEQAQEAPEWELNAIIGPNVEAELAGVVEFNRHIFKGTGKAVVRSAEIKVTTPEMIRLYRKLIPESIDPYFELSGSAETDRCIAELAETNSYAKLRTGGDAPEMFPSCAAVAHFLAACAFANVPFKCSAGLHHPMRGDRPLAQAAPDSSGPPTVKMHGFLNVFLAAALAQNGAATEEIEALLAEESAGELHFENGAVRWRDRVIGKDEVASARSSFCLSFSSCSFTEPLDDLRELGLL